MSENIQAVNKNFEERVTKVVQVSQHPVRVKLTRGMRGQYGWEIDVEASDSTEALFLIETLDRELREKFLEESKQPKQANHSPSGFEIKRSTIEEDVLP